MAVAALFLLILGNWIVWIEMVIEFGFEFVMNEMRNIGDETFFTPNSPYAGSYMMSVFAIIMESLSAVVSNQKDLIIFAASLSLYFVVFKSSYLTATRTFVVEQVNLNFIKGYIYYLNEWYE
jgi:hypothetical protein